MPPHMTGALQYRVMSARWGDILTKNSRWSDALWRWFDAAAGVRSSRGVCADGEGVQADGSQAPRPEAEAVLRRCAVLCPAAVTQAAAADAREWKDRPGLSRSDPRGLRARVRAVLEGAQAISRGAQAGS
jgi:hypothetical protein